jgi:hypothetical protein
VNLCFLNGLPQLSLFFDFSFQPQFTSNLN